MLRRAQATRSRGLLAVVSAAAPRRRAGRGRLRARAAVDAVGGRRRAGRAAPGVRARRAGAEGALREREGCPSVPSSCDARPGASATSSIARPCPASGPLPTTIPSPESTSTPTRVLYLAAGSRNHGEPVGVMREILQRIPRPLAVSILIHRVHDARGLRERDAAALRRDRRTASRSLDRGVDAHVLVGPGLGEGRPPRPAARSSSSRAGSSKAGRRTARRSRPCSTASPAATGSRARGSRGRAVTCSSRATPAIRAGSSSSTGASAKPYWAETLSTARVRVRPRRRSSAPTARSTSSGLAPHVDYFVSFVPRAGLALVGRCRSSGDLAVARAAVDALLRASPTASPRPSSRCATRSRRRRRTSTGPGRLSTRARRRAAVAARGRSHAAGADAVAGRAGVRSAGEDCLSPAEPAAPDGGGPGHVRGVGPRDAVGPRRAGGRRGAPRPRRRASSSRCPRRCVARVLEKIGELEATGFRVVRVPAFRVDLTGPRALAGRQLRQRAGGGPADLRPALRPRRGRGAALPRRGRRSCRRDTRSSRSTPSRSSSATAGYTASPGSCADGRKARSCSRGGRREGWPLAVVCGAVRRRRPRLPRPPAPGAAPRPQAPVAAAKPLAGGVRTPEPCRPCPARASRAPTWS